MAGNGRAEQLSPWQRTCGRGCSHHSKPGSRASASGYRLTINFTGLTPVLCFCIAFAVLKLNHGSVTYCVWGSLKSLLVPVTVDCEAVTKIRNNM